MREALSKDVFTSIHKLYLNRPRSITKEAIVEYAYKGTACTSGFNKRLKDGCFSIEFERAAAVFDILKVRVQVSYLGSTPYTSNSLTELYQFLLSNIRAEKPPKSKLGAYYRLLNRKTVLLRTVIEMLEYYGYRFYALHSEICDG